MARQDIACDTDSVRLDGEADSAADPFSSSAHHAALCDKSPGPVAVRVEAFSQPQP